MKIIISLISILTMSPAYATIYKCIENGKTSYQQAQCKQTAAEFALKKDISIKQQQGAVQKLTKNQEQPSRNRQDEERNENNYDPYDDRDRLLREREEKAKANRAQVKKKYDKRRR